MLHPLLCQCSKQKEIENLKDTKSFMVVISTFLPTLIET